MHVSEDFMYIIVFSNRSTGKPEYTGGDVPVAEVKDVKVSEDVSVDEDDDDKVSIVSLSSDSDMSETSHDNIRKSTASPMSISSGDSELPNFDIVDDVSSDSLKEVRMHMM